MLKKGKNRNNWAAWLLAAALAGILVVCGLGGMEAAAVKTETLDTDQACSLTVQLENRASGRLDEGTEIPVKLYKVASIRETGSFGYEAEDGFESLGLASLVAEGVEAADWKAQAEEAYEIISEAGKSESYDYLFYLTKNGAIHEGKQGELPVGLYLMVVDSLYDAGRTVQYIFSPTLISLPLLTQETGGDVYYDYDLIVSLKYRENPLYGDLIITKRLTDSVSEYLPVSFVFRVTAVDDNGETLKDEDGNTVYDNYVHAEFTESGTKQILIEGFPAGIRVKVEEVYTGASYELAEGSESQTVTIRAKGLEGDAAVGSETAAVTFSNKYDGGQTGGCGITNHYKYDEETGEWSVVEKQESGTQAGDNTSASGVTNEVWHKTETLTDDGTGTGDNADDTGNGTATNQTDNTGSNTGNGIEETPEDNT